VRVIAASTGQHHTRFPRRARSNPAVTKTKTMKGSQEICVDACVYKFPGTFTRTR
jgi:hypothetical protein